MKKILLVIITISAVQLYAGNSQFGLVDNSLGNIITPYTAAGLARSFSVAHLDSIELNFRNYATWTNISNTTFSLNLGYSATWRENRVEKTFSDFANFQGGHLAIPIMQKKIVFGIGLEPFTEIEQRLSRSKESGAESFSENTFISGGLSRANFSFAYKFSEKLSAGIGYEYTFGKVTSQTVLSINDDLESEIDYKYDNKLYGNSATLSLFVQPMEKLNVGLMMRAPVIGELTRTGITDSETLNEDINVDATLPAEYNLGLEYGLSDNLLLGMDVIYQNWQTGYKLDDKTIDQHNDYFHIGAGFERKGNPRRFVKYSSQIAYRLGAYYTQLSHLNNNSAVSEYGFTAGLSLPIDRFRSKLDIAGYIAKRGDLGNNILEEIVVGVGFSISANELWFVNIED